MPRVVVTAEEAKVMNTRQTETILKLVKGQEIPIPRRLDQLNKNELIEKAKDFNLILDLSMTKKQLIAKVEEAKEELEKDEQ